MARLDDVRAGATVRGIVDGADAVVVSTTGSADGALVVEYQLPDGSTAQTVLFRVDESRLVIVDGSSDHAGDLGVERAGAAVEPSSPLAGHILEDELDDHLAAAEPAVRTRVLEWARRLIDLSRRNRLLVYRATKRTTLVFRDPDPDTIVTRLLEGSSWTVYQPLLPADQSVARDLEESLRGKPRKQKEIVSTERDPNELAKSLEAIARRAKAEFDDRGIHSLHLVWGLLHWTDLGSEQEWSAPLVLLPVELDRPSRGEPYEIEPTEDDPTLNPALRVKLENDFGIYLPEVDLEDQSLSEIANIVTVAIGSKLPPGWRIEPYSAIGMFSFAKEPMYRDLVQNADRIQQHPAVRALALGRAVPELLPQIEVEVPSEDQLDEVQSPGHAYSVLDADSSQRAAIEAAIRGQSFVLHGPPGTGKSQTIANIISELVARGKSVLFVSQKAAALDVVANRLGDVDLRDLLLELHSARASRAEVAAEVGRTLEEQIEYEDGGFPSVARTVQETRFRLNSYANALHEVREPLGMTVHQVLAEIERLATSPVLPSGPIDPTTASEADLEQLAAQVTRLSDAWAPIEHPHEFVWQSSTVRTFGLTERQRVLDTVAAAAAATERLDTLERSLTEELERALPRDDTEREAIAAVGSLAKQPKAGPIEWLTADDLAPLRGVLDQWHARTTERISGGDLLAGTFGQRWPELRATLADDLDRVVTRAAELLGSPPSGAPPSFDEAARAAHAAADEIERIESLVDRLRASVGVRSRGDGLGDTTLLLEVARLTQQRNRPPGHWLSRARAGDARRFLDQHASQYTDVQARRRAILDSYDPAYLELDLEPILARMERFHGRWWNLLRPSHRADRKLLASLHRTRTLSPTVVADCRSAAALVHDEHELAQLDDEARAILGPYATGLATDVAATEEALAAAWRLIELPHDSTDWTTLASKAAHETPYDPAVDRMADELDESLRRVNASLEVVGRVAPGTWRATLASKRRRAAVDELRDLASTLDALYRLAAEAEIIRTGAYLDLSTLRAEAAARRSVAAIDREIADAEAMLRSALHAGWEGLDTDWERLREALQWSYQVRRLFGGSRLSVTLAERLRSGEIGALPWDAYAHALIDFHERTDAVAAYFDGPRRDEMTTSLRGTAANAAELLDQLRDKVDQLSTWVRFTAAEGSLRECGWGDFVTAAIDRRTAAADLAPAARRAWLAAWLESIVDLDDRLRGFALEEQERTIAAFRTADEKLIRLARERVLRRYEEQKPVSVAMQAGEQALIRREAAKRRRHIPVRTLLGAIPTMLPRLKPCLMMSPLSVSHFLTPEMTFDVVIFDEASQVPPEDAVNCIYRGSQLIVAGDPKQLPPTDFFQLAAIAETETELETSVDDFESVLDLARVSGYPSRPLRWHYRSRHDSLIAFSNHFVYDNSLVTFPPPHRETDELGVRFVHVPDGVFDRGRSAKNVREAQRVVAELARQIRAEPDLSVGVVAFSVAQQEAIQDEWERRLRLEPDLERVTNGDRLQALFIKNLETVQGDERDVIIFSVGYGRDETGRLLMNFGPLNRDGGWRRLNVAVTRARRKVIVVSSIRSDDFRIADAGSLSINATRGPELLRAYLEYAERGTLPGPGLSTASRGTYESQFELEVARAVRELGFEVVPQVGVSTYRVDIGVVSRLCPSRFALGIECDGASYHSAKTARDRDRLREQVLRSLGWRIHRVWSQDWNGRRASALERIRVAIEAAEAEIGQVTSRKPTEREAPIEPSAAEPVPVAKETVSSVGQPRTLFPELDQTQAAISRQGTERRRTRRESVDLNDPLDAHRLPWVIPYPVAEIAAYRRTWMDFHDYGLMKEHAARIETLVETEGPIHVDVLATRLVRAFGLQRVGSRIMGAVEDAIRGAERSGTVRRRGPFVWPASMKDLSFVRVPVPNVPQSQRNIDEIPPEEIDVALLRILESAVHASDNDLRVAAARVFGFNRTGDLIGQVLGTRIEQLHRARKIVPANGGWKLAVDLPKLPARTPTNGFRVGDWVRHPKWGTGRVVHVSGGVVTVRFGAADRRLDPVVAKLERSGPPG